VQLFVLQLRHPRLLALAHALLLHLLQLLLRLLLRLL
jgi:hypothetical protein